MGIVFRFYAASVESVQINEPAEHEIGLRESRITVAAILLRILQHDTQNSKLIVSVPVKISCSDFHSERNVYVVSLFAVSCGAGFDSVRVERLHILFCLEGASVPFVRLDVDFAGIPNEQRIIVGKSNEVVI